MTGRSLRVVFMGSPEFAVVSLQALARRHEVVAVVTQPDRPQGRGRKLAPPAVKVAAEALGLKVLQPETLRRQSVRQALEALNADLFVVAAYGKILSAKMLAIPPMGCINVHASLLPRLRGAAPIHWAVIRGEPESGITIMQMDEGMDTGPMLLQRRLALAPDETAGSLHDRLAPLGAELLLQAVDGVLDGTVAPTPQPANGSTLAPMLSKDDGQVDFTLDAHGVACHIRGMDPWPGAFASLECARSGPVPGPLRGGASPESGVERATRDRAPGVTERIKLFAAGEEAGELGATPGRVLGTDSRGLLVACGDGAVRIGELQLPGRRRMIAAALLAGRPMPTGTQLGRVADAGRTQ